MKPVITKLLSFLSNDSNSSGQSAVEYLMVFGWALVVIVIVVVALAVMVNPSKVDSERCSNLKTLLLSNFYASDDNFTAVIVNSSGRNLHNIDLTLSGSIGSTSQLKTLFLSGTFNGGDKNAFVIPYSTQNVKGKYKFNLSLSFLDSDNFSYSEKAQCKGEVLEINSNIGSIKESGE